VEEENKENPDDDGNNKGFLLHSEKFSANPIIQSHSPIPPGFLRLADTFPLPLPAVFECIYGEERNY
jgi:hypothetical protein